MTDQLITEAAIAAVKERLRAEPQLAWIRRIAKEEPDLHYEISIIANNALDAVEGVPLEAHDFVHRAVWEGALIAIGAYRIAHYKLWFGTEFGSKLADPNDIKPAPEPREFPGVDLNEERDPDGGTPDGGEAKS